MSVLFMIFWYAYIFITLLLLSRNESLSNKSEIRKQLLIFSRNYHKNFCFFYDSHFGKLFSKLTVVLAEAVMTYANAEQVTHAHWACTFSFSITAHKTSLYLKVIYHYNQSDFGWSHSGCCCYYFCSIVSANFMRISFPFPNHHFLLSLLYFSSLFYNIYSLCIHFKDRVNH